MHTLSKGVTNVMSTLSSDVGSDAHNGSQGDHAKATFSAMRGQLCPSNRREDKFFHHQDRSSPKKSGLRMANPWIGGIVLTAAGEPISGAASTQRIERRQAIDAVSRSHRRADGLFGYPQ